MQRWFRRLRQSLRKQRSGPGAAYRAQLTESGFKMIRLKNRQLVATVLWEDVRAIRAYPRDLFAYCRPCLAFQLGDDKWVEILEGDENFEIIAGRMLEVFPRIRKDWSQQVELRSPDGEALELYRRVRNGASETHPKR